MIDPFQARIAQPAQSAATATTVTEGDDSVPPAVLPVSVRVRQIGKGRTCAAFLRRVAQWLHATHGVTVERGRRTHG